VIAEHDAEIALRLYFEPINLWTVKVIDTPKDIGGLRLRANTPENAELMAALGATPNFMPSTEVYAAAQRNVVNGVLTASASIVAAKLNEVLKGGYTPNFQFVTGAVLVSKTSLQKLDPDVRKAFLEEMKAGEAVLEKFMPESDAEARAALKDKGMTFTAVSAESYKALREIARTQVWPAWVERAGADGQKALEEVLKASGG
jgi:TRAP-type C4-dicarboxylate transport system substrate-binding protein